MSVIDKKGKLFGKLNVIDLIAIVLVIAVLILVAIKLVGNGRGGLGGEGQKVVYTVKVSGVDAGVYESIQAQLPSQLMASGEMLDGYVTGVTAQPTENTSYKLDTNRDTGMMTMTETQAGTYDLIFTIETTLSGGVNNELGTQEIRVGKSHIVKTATFELSNGLILSCQPQTDTTDQTAS